MIKKMLLFTFLFVSINSIAYSTTVDLQDQCKKSLLDENALTYDSATAAKAYYCIGYINGFTNGLRLLFRSKPSPVICLPQEATTPQLIQVFLKWADENPGLLHQPRDISIMMALMKYFPCNK